MSAPSTSAGNGTAGVAAASSSYETNPSATPSSISQILPSLFGAFTARYGDQLEPDELGIIANFRASLSRFLAGQPGPSAVVHGDYRTDNVLFDAAGGTIPLAVIDWQTIQVGHAMTDVAFLLGPGRPPIPRARPGPGVPSRAVRPGRDGLPLGPVLDGLPALRLSGPGHPGPGGNAS